MLESFFIYGDLPPNVEKGVYQLPLVVLSYMVASFASYTALSLAQQLVSTKQAFEKHMLHWGGAFAMGAGIWSMHFIGMLSYKMRMVVEYDPLLTLLSMLIAIAVAYGVLAIVARPRLTIWQTLSGAVLLGLGICGMHYTGMAAMKMDGDLRYIPGIFLLSVAIAIAASAAALWMAFTLARYSSRYRYLFQICAALIMGAAICGMHYTGMLAAVFIPWADCRYDPDQNFGMLAISIAAITSIILFIALAMGIYKKTQTEFRLQNSENKLRAMINSALDAVIGMDQRGVIVEWNKQAEAIFGWSYQEAIGKSLAETIIPQEHRGAHHAGMLRFLKEGIGPILNQRIEVEALNRHGKRFPVELAVSAQKLHDKTYHFTAFVRDITVRKEAEERLLRYTAEIEATNKDLEDFSYIASHDLKEPLRGIYNFSQFLIEDYKDVLDEEGKKKLYTLQKLSQRLQDLIDNLLQYSRAGREEITFTETNLNQVLQNVLELMERDLKEANAVVNVETLPAMVCDKVRVEEIFRNLIINAVKYNDNERKIVDIGHILNHEKAPGRVLFFVKDNGIGIPEIHLETVFKMFKRLHAREAYGGGTGSGLTIVKKLVERHHGKIWAESDGKNGTIFYFTLSGG